MTKSPGESVFPVSSPRMARSLPLLLPAALAFLALFFAASVLAARQSVLTHPVGATDEDDTAARSPVIVIGFVGGFVQHDNPVHSEVQLAARLRKEYPTGVDVETFESYRGARARRRVLALLDVNHHGAPTPEEKKNARIIIYGHSWGGSEALALARALDKDGIPVLLTLQVDSVSRPGVNDTVVPANVLEAANFYQSHGLIHGHVIRAADPVRTRILGNFRFDYASSTLRCSEYPWYDRAFAKPHTQIECDPDLWHQVESLIRLNLPASPLPSSIAEAHSP